MLMYISRIFSSGNLYFKNNQYYFFHNLVKWHHLISKARDRETLHCNVRIIKTENRLYAYPFSLKGCEIF